MQAEPLDIGIKTEEVNYGIVTINFIYKDITFPLNPLELAEDETIERLLAFIEYNIATGVIKADERGALSILSNVKVYLEQIGFPPQHANIIGQIYAKHITDMQQKVLEERPTYDMTYMKEMILRIEAEPVAPEA